MVSFKCLPLYYQKISSQHQLDRKLRGIHRWSQFWCREKFLAFAKIKTPNPLVVEPMA
jgi:hypothetical protein